MKYLVRRNGAAPTIEDYPGEAAGRFESTVGFRHPDGRPGMSAPDPTAELNIIAHTLTVEDDEGAGELIVPVAQEADIRPSGERVDRPALTQQALEWNLRRAVAAYNNNISEAAVSFRALAEAFGWTFQALGTSGA